MLTKIDIERMPSFNIGFERGEAAGEAKGEARGEATGEAREQARIVQRLLGQLDVAKTAELLGLSLEEVERIASAVGDDRPDRDKH